MPSNQDDVGLISEPIQSQIDIGHIDAIRAAINHTSLDASLGIPDFILANIAIDAIVSFATGKRVMERYYGSKRSESDEKAPGEHVEPVSESEPIVFYDGNHGINLYYP